MFIQRTGSFLNTSIHYNSDEVHSYYFCTFVLSLSLGLNGHQTRPQLRARAHCAAIALRRCQSPPDPPRPLHFRSRSGRSASPRQTYRSTGLR